MSKVIDFDKANNKSKSRDIRKNTEYFIGLDIGTSSVGWAVTNTKYEVIKFNGKKCGDQDCLQRLQLQRIDEYIGLTEEDSKEGWIG